MYTYLQQKKTLLLRKKKVLDETVPSQKYEYEYVCLIRYGSRSQTGFGTLPPPQN